MKDVFVTGSEVMLGSEVIRHLRKRKDVRIIRSTMETLDITDLAAVKVALESSRPTHIIHCAAFTQVDTAEKDPLLAYSVNAEGTKNIAFFANQIGAEVLYLSTDYVFDGARKEGYFEGAQPNPINVYGRSKLAGERNLQILCERHKIVRTSWLNGLGGAHNRNFIETMLRIAETRNQLSVVNDQHGRPTFTFDLAPALVMLLDVQSYGIFHITGEGTCTWYDFACRIFREQGLDIKVRPISSDQFRSLAERPRFSSLLNTRFAAMGLPQLPPWEQSLSEYFRRRRLAESVSHPDNRGPSRDASPASAL